MSRRLATAVLAALAVLLIPGRAVAVQTDTLSLRAVPWPDGRERVVLVGAPSHAVTQALLVGDLGPRPLTVVLGVVAVRRTAAGYEFGGNVTGLARAVHPSRLRVTLEPHQEATVPVTIAAWRGDRSFAAVTADAGAVTDGPLDVVERLAVLVEGGGGAVEQGPPASTGRLSPTWAASLGAAFAVLVLAAVRERRRALVVAGARAQP